jgi:hypothetical protein
MRLEDIMSGMQRTKIAPTAQLVDVAQTCTDFSKCGIAAYQGDVAASFVQWSYDPKSVQQTVAAAPGYGAPKMAG